MSKFVSKNGVIIVMKKVKTCISKTMFLLMKSLTITLRASLIGGSYLTRTTLH